MAELRYDLRSASRPSSSPTLGWRRHVTGGEQFSPSRTFAEHWVYDPTTDGWSPLPPMPTARHGLASAAAADHWYVVGGGTGAGARTFLTLTDVIEIYTPRRE